MFATANIQRGQGETRELYNPVLQELAVLKRNFENCKRLYDIYSDIAKTYYDISKGDYISNLISEKKREEEKRMKQHKLHGR